MKNSNILLTIAIPTYNQPNEIKRTLGSLKDQLNSNKIEILILDDSNNDLTEKEIKKFEFKNLRYYRGKKIHLDYANLWLMKKAKGKYVWWFGDDTFCSNAIEKILEIIQLNPDFVWINSKSKDNIITKSIGESRWMTPNEMLFQINDLLIFLSSLLWKKEIYLREINLGEKFIGTCLAHTYPQIELFSQKIKCYYYSKPLFESETRNFQNLWYNPFIVFTKNYFDLLEFFYSKKNLKQSLKIEKKRRGVQILKGVLHYKLKGYNYGLGEAKIKDLIKIYFYWPIFWICFPIIVSIYFFSYLLKNK